MGVATADEVADCEGVPFSSLTNVHSNPVLRHRAHAESVATSSKSASHLNLQSKVRNCIPVVEGGEGTDFDLQQRSQAFEIFLTVLLSGTTAGAVLTTFPFLSFGPAFAARPRFGGLIPPYSFTLSQSRGDAELILGNSPPP